MASVLVTATDSFDALHCPSPGDDADASQVLAEICQPVANSLLHLHNRVSPFRFIASESVESSSALVSHTTSATPVFLSYSSENAAAGAAVTAGDVVEVTFGPIQYWQADDSAPYGFLTAAITEDFNVSASPTKTKTILMLDDVKRDITINFTYLVTKTGNIQFKLLLESDGTHYADAHCMFEEWCTYRILRPSA